MYGEYKLQKMNFEQINDVIAFSVMMKVNWPNIFIVLTTHVMNILRKVHVKDTDNYIFPVENVDAISSYHITMKRQISVTKLVRFYGAYRREDEIN